MTSAVTPQASAMRAARVAHEGKIAVIYYQGARELEPRFLGSHTVRATIASHHPCRTASSHSTGDIRECYSGREFRESSGDCEAQWDYSFLFPVGRPHGCGFTSLKHSLSNCAHPVVLVARDAADGSPDQTETIGKE